MVIWPGRGADECLQTLQRIARNEVPGFLALKGSSCILKSQGVAAYLDDDRKTVLLEIAEYLKEHYNQYGRGIAYLEQLAGVRAKVRKLAKPLGFLLVPQAAVQRGAVMLGNPEPHTLHTMKVTFHRFH